jgi:hypothetical protein
MRGGKESRMKDKRTRLPVLVMIALLALVLPLALAAAEDHPRPKFIQGTYAVTGANSALIAPSGFDATQVPISDVSFIVGPQVWEGTYTFHKDGTVDQDVISRSIDPPSPTLPSYSGSSAHSTGKFNYTVTAGGKITFTLVHETFKNEFLTGPQAGTANYPDSKDSDLVHSWDGRISPDEKTIQMTWGAPLVLYLTDGQGNFPGPAFIATGSFTMFRLND